jgi:adenosyl cobinamide kinase/adenosyl cobinamide phosphate guanylyltransferase
MTANRFVLVGGGVRSGKSAFALERARSLGARRVFLATAQRSRCTFRKRSPSFTTRTSWCSTA